MFRSNLFYFLKRMISLVLVLLLVIDPNLSYAQSAFVSALPQPGVMLGSSAAFTPVLVKGLVVHPDKPLNFDFIVDSGNDSTDQFVIKEQSQRIAKYFLAAITVPEDQLWVNLSPYEKDRIIENDLALTVLGRDMLAQDYMLKQLTASMIYPEEGLGKDFWAKVYAQAQEKFGTTDIPVDTFNKVWITPDKAEVFEKGNAVYVTDAKLKVMLDTDYTALQRADTSSAPTTNNATVGEDLVFSRDNFTKQILREVILPAIEKEVNEGKNFAAVRQVYHAAILAKWYRELIQNTLLADAYVGKNQVAGLTADEKTLKEEIYQRYIAAYKKGVFDYIKEEENPLTGERVPRKFFSGGLDKFGDIMLDRSQDAGNIVKDGDTFQVECAMNSVKSDGLADLQRSIPSSLEDTAGQEEWQRIKTLLRLERSLAIERYHLLSALEREVLVKGLLEEVLIDPGLLSYSEEVQQLVTLDQIEFELSASLDYWKPLSKDVFDQLEKVHSVARQMFQQRLDRRKAEEIIKASLRSLVETAEARKADDRKDSSMSAGFWILLFANGGLGFIYGLFLRNFAVVLDGDMDDPDSSYWHIFPQLLYLIICTNILYYAFFLQFVPRLLPFNIAFYPVYIEEKILFSEGFIATLLGTLISIREINKGVSVRESIALTFMSFVHESILQWGKRVLLRHLLKKKEINRILLYLNNYDPAIRFIASSILEDLIMSNEDMQFQVGVKAMASKHSDSRDWGRMLLIRLSDKVIFDRILLKLDHYKNAREQHSSRKELNRLLKYFENREKQKTMENIDSAQLEDKQLGGIDIKSVNVNKKGSAKIQFDDQVVQDVLKNGFNGFTPVIINITPIQSPSMIFGVNESGF